MNENQKVFAEALRLFVNNKLLNDMGWELFAAVAKGELATVKIGMTRGGLIIIPIKCQDVTSLEKDLKQAQKTIKQQQSQIEDLTPKEETPTAEEPEEVKLIAKAPETTRTRRKRTA